MEYNDAGDGLSIRLRPDQGGGYFFGNTPAGAYACTQPNGRWQFSPSRADFNQDDFVDLAMQDAAGDVHLRHLGTPDTDLFTDPANVSGWRLSGSGDFNWDGRTDLLWQCQIPGEPQWLYCWHMKGSSLTQAALLTPNTIFGHLEDSGRGRLQRG